MGWVHREGERNFVGTVSKPHCANNYLRDGAKFPMRRSHVCVIAIGDKQWQYLHEAADGGKWSSVTLPTAARGPARPECVTESCQEADTARVLLWRGVCVPDFSMQSKLVGTFLGGASCPSLTKLSLLLGPVCVCPHCRVKSILSLPFHIVLSASLRLVTTLPRTAALLCLLISWTF